MTTTIFSRLCTPRASAASTVPCCRSGTAPHDRQIGALQRSGPAVIGELVRQALMRAVVLGHDEQAGGVLVEPMHDARPLHAADARQAVAAMGDERVHERAGLMSRRRVDDQPGRLVDDDEVVVLVHDGKIDGFRLRLGRHRGGLDEHELRAGDRPSIGIERRDAVDRYTAVPDERLQPARERSGHRRAAPGRAAPAR